MKPGKRGKTIYLTDTRTGPKRLFPFEQKPWFWPAVATLAFSIFATLTLILTPAKNPTSIIAAIITGSLALALTLAIRKFRIEHFRLMRAVNRTTRVEREMERFIIKMLRGIRLPLKTIRNQSKEIGKLCKEIHDQIGGIDLPEQIKTIIAEPKGGQIFQDAKSIWKSALELDTLPQGLLKLGKIRKTNPQMAWLDTQTIVIETLHDLKHLIDKTQANIKIKPLPPCLADRSLVQQIFAAIIQNALENLSPHRQPTVRIWGFTEKAKVIYSIEDNGIGIEDKEIEKIFEIFYRINPASTGPGVGLALVRRAVENHNGRIWVNTSPDKGSTFSFSLPAR